MKRKAPRINGLFLVVAMWSATASFAAEAAKPSAGAYTGTLQKALYRIDIPADWNGDLVMLVHGYQPVGSPIATPMTPAESPPL
jgi:hypothetical protein